MKLKFPRLSRQSEQEDVQAGVPGPTGDLLRCPLCGHRFKREEATGCQVCPSVLRCKRVMCPNCHYEFPKE